MPPTPHRFLAGRRQPSPPKAPRSTVGDGFERPTCKTGSSIKKKSQDPATPGDAFDLTPKQRPSSGQFAQTPRFSVGRLGESSRPKSPTGPTLAAALRASIPQVEDVHEVREHDEDDEEMLDQGDNIQPATESGDSIQDGRNDLPYSPKRRKLGEIARSHPATTTSPARSMFKPPVVPASQLHTGAHRSDRSSSVASSVVGGEGDLRRPAFLRPSVAYWEQTEPVPESFSPHRRGGKFVPGGMAATLQQWVVETGQSVMQSRKGKGYLRGEDYVFRIKVDSVAGNNPMLVQGRQQSGAEMHVLLMVDAKRGRGEILAGSVVGIRAPAWEVEVEGSTWSMGVDWKVIAKAGN